MLTATREGVRGLLSLRDKSWGELDQREQVLACTMERIVVLHPLDYMYRGKDTRPDVEMAISMGWLVETEDLWNLVRQATVESDPGLLRALDVYRRVAGRHPSRTGEVESAVSYLYDRFRTEINRLAMPRRIVMRLSACMCFPTAEAQLDALIHVAHFDPDLLRHHSEQARAMIGTAVSRWLDHLAGRASA